MTPSQMFVVPCIDADHAVGFVNLVDEPNRSRLVIIDNTDDQSVQDRLSGYAGHIYAPGRNLGVAASWNYGCRWAFEQGAVFATLTSSSVRMWDGGHMLCRTADEAAKHGQWPYGFESLNGWHLFTLGRKTWDIVGEFDEQFHPAYFEDNDYIWRMRCAGILEPQGGDRSQRLIPWVGAIRYACEDAHAIKSGRVSVNLAELERKYVAKWGGKPGAEKVYGFSRGGPVPGSRTIEVRAELIRNFAADLQRGSDE